MRNRTTLRAVVAAAALGLTLAGTGVAAAAPEAAPIRHDRPGLLAGSASAGSAAAGSAARGSADLAICLLLEVAIPLPVCLLLS
ncbi:hypothetical protein [Nocardia sp. NPDC058480]|uniref:hypothetical protein n=1 Tax=Nocardia sp. NPDC058480 TaxID=3346522 RepID=UPI003651F9D9